MILSKQQLFSVTVVTTRGIAIGRVIDVGLDSVSQSIVTYQVRPYWKWRKTLQSGQLLPSPLSIHRSQVVRMTVSELVVEDGSVPLGVQDDVAAVRATRQSRQQAAIRGPL